MPSKPRARRGRKLLVASVGVATLSFVGVRCSCTSVANLPAPPSCLEQPQDPYCYGPKPDAGMDADGATDAPSDGSDGQ
jgi:hypothetical protein